MKSIIGTLLLILAAIIAIFLCSRFILNWFTPVTKQNSQNNVCINSKCFAVELAITFSEQEQGLMGREKLDEQRGMLFIFKNEGIYSFWMKNVLIPLDIIWINKDGKIVFLNKNSQPCKQIICPPINPNDKASYILEINAGLAEKYNFKVGDQVNLEISNTNTY